MCYDMYNCDALRYGHLHGQCTDIEAKVAELKGNVEGATQV